MTRTVISTPLGPAAIGPYSQAILAGDFLFVSGQIPIDPATGQVVERTIAAQTNQVLNNIASILKEAGRTFAHVVKTEVYLKDLNHFKEMNEIYANWFTAPIKPARQAMQVGMLPLDVLVEISCIVYMG